MGSKKIESFSLRKKKPLFWRFPFIKARQVAPACNGCIFYCNTTRNLGPLCWQSCYPVVDKWLPLVVLIPGEGGDPIRLGRPRAWGFRFRV